MPSATSLGAGAELNQFSLPALSLDRQLAAMRGAETPQAPLTVRQSSPPPSTARMAPMMPAKFLAGPPKSERGNMVPMLAAADLQQSQLQMQLQAKANSQIQAFQAMVQAQAQAYALSQIQPQVQALTKSHQQSQLHMSQIPAPAQAPGAAQAYAQMQQAVAQQSMLARQGTSKASLLQMQRQTTQPQQPQPQSDEAHAQMQRQLQEQVVAQVWAQAQVQQQRESSSQMQQLTGRGRQTLVRQTSWAGNYSAPMLSPQVSSQPVAITQRTDPIRRTSDSGVLQGPPSTRTLEPLAAVKTVQPSSSSVQIDGSADLELLPGLVVYIDGSRFEIMQPLGMGSYGMVWSALSDENIEVAVKEILCRSQGELTIAHFEGNLLAKLGQMESGACRNGRLPALVAQETAQIANDKSWRVRLAMSRIPGMPLMILLEQHREYKKAQSEPVTNGESNGQTNGSTEPQPFPERPEPRLPGETPLAALLRKLTEPCLFTKELVVQIFPTLERIAAVAYHRDINPRNILVDPQKRPGPPNYGLVDFGMAVDAGQWRSDARGNWNTLEVGGDCRYWPVSAWVMFLHGPQELTPGAPWRLEYQTQLDIHALGITALQVFVELLPSSQDLAAGMDEGDDGCLKDENSLLAKIKALIDAWTQYWEDAMDFWSCLIDCFTNNGDWNALKRACINHGVMEAITRDLVDLRTTLAEAGAAFEAAAASAAKAVDATATPSSSSTKTVEAAEDIQAVFRCISALISVGDTTQFPNWRTLHRLLDLPSSMEDLACVKTGSGSVSRVSAVGMANSVSANKLSTSTLTPARSCYNMITPAPTPGPLISRGISVGNDLGGPKSSPAGARRQASMVRDVRESSVGAVPSTSRMISVVTSGSPMCSPRGAAQVLVDARGRHTVMPAPQHSTIREPISGRRSGSNIASSPPGPSRTLMREHSLADNGGGQRSKAAFMPSSPSYGQKGPDLSPPPKFNMQNSVVRSTSTAVAPQNSVVRGTSIVTSSGVHESSSSTGGRASSLTNAGSPDFANSGRGGGMVTVMTKNSSSPSEFTPGQIIRGSSVVTSNQNFKRSHSPVGRGSSVVIETMASSRGPSVVTGAGNRGSSVSIEAAPTARRAAASYVGEINASGPSPSQGVRNMMVMPSPPAIFSARQWAPTQGITTTGSDIADLGSATSGAGVNTFFGASHLGYGSGEASATALPQAPFQPQMFGPMGIGGMLYSS